MSSARVTHVGPLSVDASTAFAWLTRAGAQARLLPPWENIRVTAEPADGPTDALQTSLLLRCGPVTRSLVLKHRVDAPTRMVEDRQVTGPFSRWEHRRTARDRGAGSEFEEAVDWTLPMGLVGAMVDQWIPARIERALRYRHAVLRDDLALLAARPIDRRLRVAVTGASGMVGKALVEFLRAAGHTAIPMVRRPALPGEIQWDPARKRLEPQALAGLDAVVHLAGANLAGRRWSTAYKRTLWDSRIGGTRLVAEAMAALPDPPGVLVSASAVGWYGDRGNEDLSEAAGPGTGFLADLCRAWEDAAAPARAAGVRVVHPRSGMILSPTGGALGKMLPPFRAGLGGRLGTGRQWVSWISLDDVVGGIYWALADGALEGAINLTAPEPVTNRDLTAELGRALRRPTFGPPVPAAALRLALGEMADQAVLASHRVVPAALTAAGYPFRHRSLAAALTHVLGRG